MLSLWSIAYKNLWRKKTRTLLTVVGIALSAWVLTSLLGFNRGYEASINHDIDNMGYQILLTAKGCPYEAATLMLKGGVGLKYLPESVVATVKKYPAIAETTPMLMAPVFDPNKGENGGLTVYQGVDPQTFPKLKSFLKLKKGQWFTTNSNEVVLGYEAAELEQREVGDVMLVKNKLELTVVGILERTGTQDDGTIFVPLKVVQAFSDKTGQITGIGIKVKKDASFQKLEDELYKLPDVQVISMVQVKNTITSLVATAKVMVFSIAIIAILISIIGVVNTILMSVFERFQEIGILKSMGATPKDIFTLIWLETVILCTAGGIVGTLAAFFTATVTDLLLRRLLPYAPTGSMVIIDMPLLIFTFVIILVIGTLSGLYPAWAAAKIRPIEAIRQEGE
jgi:putative ABC transport system permease protein